MRAAIGTVDPAAPERPAEGRRLDALLYDHLVRVDEQGQPQPALAVSWQHDAQYRRWSFRLRQGVRFHDGSALSPAATAAALQATVKGAAISAAGDSVSFQCESARPNLPLELAHRVGAIFLRNADGAVTGTGPFQLARWDPGQHALLSANEHYWEGRPFLDSIEIEMGRSTRDQFIDLELGKTDLIEMGWSEVRRAGERSRKTWISAPAELVALQFSGGRSGEGDARVREALALSIDREAIYNVLLQKQGEVSGGLLPQWLSGYAFLFPADQDLERARRLLAGVPAAARSLTLSYDPAAPLARLFAERVAINARDAGITLRVSPANPRADLRLASVELGSLHAAQALTELCAALNLPEPVEWGRDGAPAPEALYTAERKVLEGFRTVPLFHLPEIYGVSARVRTWLERGVTPLGAWRLDDVWLAGGTP
jgi:ABC-type transport system substrate-binding protein